MNRDCTGEGSDSKNRAVLGELTNILGKRPLPLDSDKSDKENKLFRYQLTNDSNNSAKGKQTTSFLSGIFQDLSNSKETNLSLGLNTTDGFNKENAVNPMSYGLRGFGDLNCELGTQESRTICTQEKESSPELQEDYETDSDEPSKYVSLNESSDLGAFNFWDKGKGKVHVPGSLDFKIDNMGCSSNVCNNASNGASIIGSEKSCKCSFCIKAAYIWTDLHYQDVIGRLSSLKKSKKLARLLEGKISGDQYANIRASKDEAKQVAKVEFELMQQWRSLFLSTENVLVHETAQLHSTLMRLEELREKCKKDLHLINRK